MWRADVVHCGAAYDDFNARIFAYVELADIPRRMKRKCEHDGSAKTFVVPDSSVAELAVVRASHGGLPPSRYPVPGPPRKK